MKLKYKYSFIIKYGIINIIKNTYKNKCYIKISKKIIKISKNRKNIILLLKKNKMDKINKIKMFINLYKKNN